MSDRRRLFCLILLCFVFLQGNLAFATPDSKELIIKSILREKEQAVNQKNQSQFLSIIDQENSFYVQEQIRWFSDAIRYIDPNSFHLELIHVYPQQGNHFCADVKQSFRKNGNLYSVVMPIRIRKTEEGWRDSDLDFLRLQNGPVVVSYTRPEMEEKAYIALDTIKRALYVIQNRYHWNPKRVEVKLYHDPELFRQSVKLSLPIWAGGWNEDKQSIKLIVSKEEPNRFASAIVHELTHQMVSDLTQDNAAYWLQEGAAMYYETHLLPGLHEEKLPEEDQVKPKYTLAELQKLNLEKLPDQDAYQYYYSSYQLFRFLIDEFGEERMDQLFKQLRQYPYINMDTVMKQEKLNQLTNQAIQKVFSLTEQQLDHKWKSQFQKN